MQKLILISTLLILPSSAFAQSPTTQQFQSYRQSMAQKVGNFADQESICETSAQTLLQLNQQLQKQVVGLKADLAKAKSQSVPNAAKPEHNPPSP